MHHSLPEYGFFDWATTSRTTERVAEAQNNEGTGWVQAHDAGTESDHWPELRSMDIAPADTSVKLCVHHPNRRGAFATGLNLVLRRVYSSTALFDGIFINL
jgi:hypothetical protein